MDTWVVDGGKPCGSVDGWSRGHGTRCVEGIVDTWVVESGKHDGSVDEWMNNEK